jgi:prostaglandin-H2 D-isomerase / glutathione transferase
MSTYKLYYFNARGRVEVSRLIFAAAGEKFEDIRYEFNDWPSHKPEMPLGQVPVLEIDGVKLPQSMTIARFLAKQFNLAGKDNLEQAEVDAVVDTVADMAKKFGPIRFEEDEAKKQVEMPKFFADELPKHLKNLEVLAKAYSNDGPFFVGNQLTWCDLLVYDVLETFLAIDGNVLSRYPWLQHNRQEVEKQPKITAYLKKRPETPF